MLTIPLKDRDVNPRVKVELGVILGWARMGWGIAGLGPFVVTSLKDGKHKAGSQHRQDIPEALGEAADIRTWQHWFWTDEQAKEHFATWGKLPPEKKWRDCGHHSQKLLSFAHSLQAAGIRVVVHPDQLDGVPHLHVAIGHAVFVYLGD